MAPLEPSLLEEGMLVHVATRLVAGERLYADVASFTGPLPFEALAALFRIFGEEIAVARGAVAVLHGLACACLFALARGAGTGAFAHSAAAAAVAAPVLLFPLLSIYFYSTLAGGLALIAAWAAWRGTRTAGLALVAGVLVALVALTKQTVGAALALSLWVALAGCTPGERRLRTVLAYVAGGMAVAALTLGTYAARGTWDAVLESLVLLPLSFDDTFASVYMNLWPPGELTPDVRRAQAYYLPFLYVTFHGVMLDPSRAMVWLSQALYALPWLAPIATALARLRGPLPAAVWIHGALQVALLSHLFPRTDWGHLVFVLPASLVQLLLLAAVLLPGRRLRRLLAAGAAATLLGPALYLGAALHLSAGEPTWGPRVPLRPVSSPYRSEAVPRVLHHLRERAQPGEPIFVARAEPLLYFASGLRNPTPYSGVVPGAREIQERTILAALEDVRFVVMSEIDQPLYTYYRDQLPRVQAYLERHFQVPLRFLEEEESWLLLYERRADPGPTAIDLFDHAREAGRRFIRDEEGRARPFGGLLPELATRLNRRPLLVALGPGGGGIDLDVRLPAGAVLEADHGLSVLRGPDRRYELAPSGEMRVAVAPMGSDAFQTLARKPMEPQESAGWSTLQVDLAAYGNRAMTLRLEVVLSEPPGPRQRLFWWGSPRVRAVASP